MKRLRKILIISLSAILAFVLVIHPIFAVVLYEAIFSMRYEPSPEYAFTADRFDSLAVERVELVGDGERLVGFKYSNPTVTDPKGLVVFAHGLGGGGHTPYLPLLDAFTDLGYLVFTYDATGNGESDGKDTHAQIKLFDTEFECFVPHNAIRTYLIKNGKATEVDFLE